VAERIAARLGPDTEAVRLLTSNFACGGADGVYGVVKAA